MTTTASTLESNDLVLHFGPLLRKLSNRDFLEFCHLNKDRRFERTAEGDLIVMAPTGGETGIRNFTLTVQFGAWADADGTGIGFDSSTGFSLPNGAIRSPDLAWVKAERWNLLTGDERQAFSPVC